MSAQLELALGHGLAGASAPGENAIPQGVNTSDGVSVDEAVAIALWNNPSFQEALAELGFQRAEVLQAGLLTNPVFSVLFPLGPKQLELTAKLPLEIIWLRPKRVAIARARSERAGALLVQGGLDLARDVNKAHAALELARKRVELAGEIAAVRGQVADLEAARLRAGDSSELDVGLVQADALTARHEAQRAELDAVLEEQRLVGLLGVQNLSFPQSHGSIAGDFPQVPEEASSLVAEALAARPDLRAAELAIEAAEKQIGLSRWELFAMSGIADANGEGKKGFDAGPGLELTVPIFHQNQGVVARANAEFERVARHYVTVRDAIGLEVRQAHARYLQEVRAERAWRMEVVPALEEALGRLEMSHETGETSPFSALEGRVRLLKALTEHAVLEASVRQAMADLERSLGHKLGPPAPSVTFELAR